MESSTPIICFRPERKWFQIFKIETLSMDAITSARTCLHDNLFRSITILALLVDINLFILPKNNLTLANSGVYCDKYTQVPLIVFM